MFTRQNGHNTFSEKTIIVVLILILFAFTSCGGMSDWEYDLPNNYSVVRVNSQTIVFGKNEETFNQIIDRYIWEFCYNESYIGLKRLPMDNIPADEIIDIEQWDFSRIEYYIVDATNDILYGAYDYDEYAKKCEDLNVGKMCEWIDNNTD